MMKTAGGGNITTGMTGAAMVALLAASRPHVLAACKRKRGLFAAYPDLTREDLASAVNVGLIEAVQRGQGPRPGKLSTWVGMIAGRRLLDVAKGRSRGLAREKAVGEEAARDAAEDGLADGADAPPELAAGSGEPLEEWAERVYEWACRQWPAGAGGRRGGLTVPQRTALLAIQRRQRASSRGMVLLLTQRPALCRVLGLRASPSHSTIVRLTSPESGARKGRESRVALRVTAPTVEIGGCLRLAGRLDRIRNVMRDFERLGYAMTPEAVAECLGVGVGLLRRWRKDRKHLAYRRVGRIVRYSRADVEAFAESAIVYPVNSSLTAANGSPSPSPADASSPIESKG